MMLDVLCFVDFFFLAPSESLSISRLGEHRLRAFLNFADFFGSSADRLRFRCWKLSMRAVWCWCPADRTRFRRSEEDDASGYGWCVGFLRYPADRARPRGLGEHDAGCRGCLSVPADLSRPQILGEQDAGRRGFVFGGYYDDWPTAKGDHSSGVRTDDAKIPSLCYYKYFFQCGDVGQHSWLVWGVWSTDKDVSSGKTTSVCSLLDVCVYSRSVGR